jgi:hypothetical protein
MWWPVIGHKHNDVEFFDFKWQHYHIDPRFLSRGHLTQALDRIGIGKLGDILGRPLNDTKLPDGPPKPGLRRMRCTRVEISYPFSDARAVILLNQAHAGEQCAHGKRGWVCPHKHIALGNIAPIDGVITCRCTDSASTPKPESALARSKVPGRMSAETFLDDNAWSTSK